MVIRSGETLLNLSIRVPLQSLRDSFPPGDAFAVHTLLIHVPFIGFFNLMTFHPDRRGPAKAAVGKLDTQIEIIGRIFLLVV